MEQSAAKGILIEKRLKGVVNVNYTQDGSSYIVRIDRGEDVMAKLAEFARETDIGSATITGIGAASEVELGIYSAEISAYKHYTYKGDLEIISLTGNITKKDGAYHVHLHSVVSDGKSVTVGGHVERCIIVGTSELRVQMLEKTYSRKLDEETGLHILDI